MWRVQSYQSASADTAFDLSGADYYAYIEDKDRMQIMPTAKAVAISRGKYSPSIVGKVREMDKTKVTIRIRAADEQAALADLVAACPNDEEELGTLTVVDRNGVEWTLQANVVNILRTNMSRVYEMPLDVPDLIWRKVAAGEVWNVTASGQEHTVTNTGNKPNRPVFIFEGTAIKLDGFLFSHWVPVRNQHSNAYNFKALDLTDGGVDSRNWVKDTARYVQINNGAGITNSQTTIPYDTVTGSIPDYGMGYIDNGVNVEQICWTDRTGTTSGNLTGVTRGIGGTTARAFADNVKIYFSYCQADLRDVRVYKNGLEQNAWIDAPNTASTKIWIVATEPAGISLTLGAAISNVGDITEINFKPTVANRLAINSLPKEGVLRINDEACHFTDRDPIKLTVDVDLRSINDTSAGSHAVDDMVYFIPNDYWLYMGNPYMDAQETDDTRKPILDMTNSDNVTRVFTSFGSDSGLRADSWRPDVEMSSFAESLKASQFYGGDHTDDAADPYTEAGMLVRSIYRNGAWKYETGKITWTIYEAGGIDRVVEYIYETYKSGSTYPAWVKIEKSKNNTIWEAVTVLTPPASAGSWGSPTTAGPHAVTTGYYYLRLIMWGSQVAGQSGGVGLLSALEFNSFKYEVEFPLVPEIMARHEGAYEHNFRLINQTTGEYFKVILADKLNGEFEVDCDAKTLITLADNRKRRAAIYIPNTQRDWMTFAPGDNDLKLIEASVTGLQVTIVQTEMLAA